jgi:hypothetical protein
VPTCCRCKSSNRCVASGSRDGSAFVKRFERLLYVLRITLTIQLQAKLHSAGSPDEEVAAICARLLGDSGDGGGRNPGVSVAALESLAAVAVGQVGGIDAHTAAVARAAATSSASSSLLKRLPAVAATVRALLQPSLRPSLAPLLVGCDDDDNDYITWSSSNRKRSTNKADDHPARRARPLVTPTVRMCVALKDAHWSALYA